MTVCPKCGSEVDANSKFCRKCGEKLPDTQTAVSPGSTVGLGVKRIGIIAVVVIAILGFFLTRRPEGELAVKVRTDFSAGNDTTFVDGLNIGISKPKMK